MCFSSPKTPPVPQVQEQKIAAPTYADAKATKSTAATRNKTAALAGRDIKTSSRGLSDEAQTEKKKLLGE